MAFSLLNSKALVNTQIRYFLLLAYRVNWLTEVSGNESVIFESYSLNKDLNLLVFLLCIYSSSVSSCEP